MNPDDGEKHTAFMSVSSKYPVPAAMMQPTNNPIMTAQDFIMGLPNLSQRMIVAKTANPSPVFFLLAHFRYICYM